MLGTVLSFTGLLFPTNAQTSSFRAEFPPGLSRTAGAAAEVVKSMEAHAKKRRIQTGDDPLVTLPGMDCSTSPYADTYYGCARLPCLFFLVKSIIDTVS